MTRYRLLVCGLLFWCSACSPPSETEPSGPIARFGSTPVIDGVIEVGEWDDAEIVRLGAVEQFRMKHDGVNLYFAVKLGGGILLLNTNAGVRVLHWSAQLGSAEYVKSDTVMQILVSPFSWELWGLWRQPREVIQDSLARYLADNGWVSNTASMGNVMESELAVSFEWLGVHTEPGMLMEIGGLSFGGGLLMSREDRRGEELLAMPREVLDSLYPSVSWPAESALRESIGMGPAPDTIRVHPGDFATIWVDFRR